MKFCKQSAAAYESIGVKGVRPFPYKQLKKHLKSSVTCKSTEQISARFFECLHSAVRQCDREWTIAAMKVRLFNRLSGLPRDAVDMALRLAAWAELSREAVRKIVKKYNKWYGSTWCALEPPTATPLVLAAEHRARSVWQRVHGPGGGARSQRQLHKLRAVGRH